MRIVESALVDIHPQAYVECGVTLGEGSVIRQFASVVRGARLGRSCVVSDTACVDGAFIGDGCRVGGGARLNPGLLAEANVFFGPNCVICNDVWPTVGKHGFDLSRFDESHAAVVLEEGASIGANAVILPGVRIGARAMIAAGAVVTRDVPADCLWRDGRAHPVERAPERMRFAS
jgi:UDP-2-acetamido-3-amino-2,3-dideoxy-glucuronate N-acetyltransferase